MSVPMQLMSTSAVVVTAVCLAPQLAGLDVHRDACNRFGKFACHDGAVVNM